MKNKIAGIFSALLMMILFIVVVAIGFIIYLTINVDSNDVIYEFIGEKYVTSEEDIENSKAVQKQDNILDKVKLLVSDNKKAEEVVNYSAQTSESNFFYNQLNDYEKKIYNGLQENKKNMMSGTYLINYGNVFSNVLSEENGSEKLGDYYQAAVEAFTHDNIDLFFLNVNKMYLNIETTKKLSKTTYKVYISPKSGETYFSDGFTSQEQVEEALSQIEKVKDSVITNLSGNSYKDIVKIHDYLIDNNEYDQTYKSMGTYTIYGSLVKHTSVCEGYAKALKYLLNAAGIKCELIQGTATNTSGKTESHAWNAVYLDEKWYYVDVTWDDPIVMGGGTLTIRNKHRYLLKSIDTFKKDHAEEYQFTENGKVFSYPEISKYDY